MLSVLYTADVPLCRKTKGITSDSSAVDLLRQMLVYNPGKRITAAEALEHPYFKQVDLLVLSRGIFEHSESP